MATSQPEINSRLATITNQLEQDLRAIILDAARAAAPVVESDLLTDAEILVSMGRERCGSVHQRRNRCNPYHGTDALRNRTAGHC